MNPSFKTSLWKQFGATIDMLENAITACPDKLWAGNGSQFWYNAYHTLFYLDYYLSEEPLKFTPPAPFTLSELEPDVMPERVYTKAELLAYLEHGRNKCRKLIAALSDEKAAKRFINEWTNYSMLEIIIYNMRHVQHHTGQLNLLLRQGINDAPKWVSQTKTELQNINQ